MVVGLTGVHYLLRWPKPMPGTLWWAYRVKGVDVIELLEFWCVAWISWLVMGGMVSNTWVTLAALVFVLVVTNFGKHGDWDG